MSMELPKIVGIYRNIAQEDWQTKFLTVAKAIPGVIELRDSDSWRTHLFLRPELSMIPSGSFETEEEAESVVTNADSPQMKRNFEVAPHGLEIIDDGRMRGGHLVIKLFSISTPLEDRAAVATQIQEKTGKAIRTKKWGAGVVIGRTQHGTRIKSVSKRLTPHLPSLMTFEPVKAKVMAEATVR